MTSRSSGIRVGVWTDRVGGSWESPSSVLRLLHPWHSSSAIRLVSLNASTDPKLLGSYALDAIIFQRLAPSTHAAAQTLKCAVSMGIPAFLDIDDDFAAVGRDPSHEQASEAAMAWERVTALFPLFDRIWVSTQPLANSLSGMNVSVRVRPTLPPARTCSSQRKGPRKSGPLSVLYFGTTTHRDDWCSVEQVLAEYCKRGALQVTLVGITDAPPGSVGMRAIDPDGRVASRYFAFMDWLGRVNQYDVGIAPLQPTPVNLSKSALKVFEYGQLGVLPVASDFGPYGVLEALGHKDLLVASSPSAWRDAVERILRTRPRELAERAQAVARDLEAFARAARASLLAEDLTDLTRDADAGSRIEIRSEVTRGI